MLRYALRRRHRGESGDLRVSATRGRKPPDGLLRGRGQAGGGRPPAPAYLAVMLALTLIIAFLPGVLLLLPNLLG